MGLRQLTNEARAAEDMRVIVSSGPEDPAHVSIQISYEWAVTNVSLKMTPDQARRLGRALLQHAARLTLSAGRNLTQGPGGSAVDTDGSTG